MTYATSGALIAISFLFPILGIVAVALRFYTRRTQKAGYGVDDWLLVPALIIQYAIAGLLLWGAFEKSLGYTTPAPTVPGPQGFLFSMSPEQERFSRIQYVCNLLNPFAYGLIKLSLLFFYRRLFCGNKTQSRVFDIITKVSIVIIAIWTLAFGFGAIFLCGTNWSAHYDILIVVTQKCSAQLKFLHGFAISDFVTDVFIFILPVPQIWQLHMPVHRKIAVSSIFMVGLIALGASLTRMVIYSIYLIDAFSQPDGEILITILLFWSMMECGVGLVVACMPTLRPLFGKLSADAILGSLRNALSVVSLRSFKGRDSNDTEHSGTTPIRSFDNTTRSQSHGSSLAGPMYPRTTVTSSTDRFDPESQKSPSNGSIMVETDLDQTEFRLQGPHYGYKHHHHGR